MSDDKPVSEDLAVENLMRTEDGRRFIWGQLLMCNVFDSTFDADPIQSAYNSGMRDAGLLLRNRVRSASPDYYLKMIKEYS